MQVNFFVCNRCSEFDAEEICSLTIAYLKETDDEKESVTRCYFYLCHNDGGIL